MLNKIYLDYAASTPIDKAVIRETKKIMKNNFYNPSSIYKQGVLSKRKLEEARKTVSKTILSRKEDIYFTNGGTESINSAILGLGRYYLKQKAKQKEFIPHIITLKTEHPAVLESCKKLEEEGCEVTYLNVDKESGIVNPNQIKEEIRDNTVLVTIAYVNGEIGVISPLKEISKVILESKEKRGRDKNNYPYFHTDASQAPNYLSVQVEKLGVDMMTLDGAKIYGPKGSGILYKKHFVNIEPIFFGGSQEKGIRAGTENLASAVGFSIALKKAQDNYKQESERLNILQNYFYKKITTEFPKIELNGSNKFGKKRISNNLNFCFKNMDVVSEMLVIQLDKAKIFVSATTACKNLDDVAHSYVIENLEDPKEKGICSKSSIRFTFGRDTNKRKLNKVVKKLRSILQ